jgi:ferric-dicitrate binding protein FerR (iron transport regulator)
MDINQGNQLLQKYLDQKCTPEEASLVERWYAELESTGEIDMKGERLDKIGKAIEARLIKKIQQDVVVDVKVRPAYPRRVWWAAASFLILLAAGTYFILRQNVVEQKPAVVAISDSILAPNTVKATITLANGQQVLIDSLSKGNIANDHGVKLVKLASGEITYVVDGTSATGELAYNTLSNPRGSRVATIVLADGTKVWLNAASSLTYPVAFIGNNREVTITGEAYFEVARYAAKPFVVKARNAEVNVLGTHFNINAFDEEAESKVTLLEGSVKVFGAGSNGLLKPGQQARVGNQLQVTDNVDTEQVMAWKNGIFHFENATLRQLLLEIGRWYDVEVHYTGAVPQRQFGGEISRNSSLDQVLQILRESDIKFQVSGNKMIVGP